MATGTMHKKFGEIWLCSFQVLSADRQRNKQRQTEGHTHHNTSHPSGGRSNNVNGADCCA